MTQFSKKRTDILVLLPILGMIIFIALYFVATILYPGGSQADKNSVGFSWMNNYWCNLLSASSINGQRNIARPFAIGGMLVLGLAFSAYWFVFPLYFHVNRILKSVIQSFGPLSMLVAFLLFTKIDHDLIINLASVFGLIAVAGVFIGLYKSKMFWLFGFGCINILLVGLNNYFYYTKGLIVYLPILQKISFGTFLIWICGIDLIIYRWAKQA